MNNSFFICKVGMKPIDMIDLHCCIWSTIVRRWKLDSMLVFHLIFSRAPTLKSQIKYGFDWFYFLSDSFLTCVQSNNMFYSTNIFWTDLSRWNSLCPDESYTLLQYLKWLSNLFLETLHVINHHEQHIVVLNTCKKIIRTKIEPKQEPKIEEPNKNLTLFGISRSSTNALHSSMMVQKAVCNLWGKEMIRPFGCAIMLCENYTQKMGAQEKHRWKP